MASKKGKGFKISRDELNKKVEEYLAKGKTITKCEYVPPHAIGYSVKSSSKGPKTGEKLDYYSLAYDSTVYDTEKSEDKNK
mgnify:FL=1|tara:strand:+ start:5459 stop:5701 length:243 start_codon:yes stop_codon:yes gene_type:complete